MTAESPRGWRATVGQAWRFGLVSLAGLLLDTSVFLALVAAGIGPFAANAAGGTLAVMFVFVASVRRIFLDRSRLLIGKFMAYLAYQVVLIIVASLAVELLVARAQLAPLLAKVLVLPFTFSANFGFMRWLTRARSPR